LAAALVLAGAGLLALRAALPLSRARWGLHMDERIPYDAVQAILHPADLEHWVRAVVDGGDQRYGRLFFNAAALVSALPERLAGPQGQILATRILQIVALLAALGLLLTALVPPGPWRLLGALCLVASAPAEYYLAMPKPEPMQALCLAVFIGLAAWNGWRFGWHWLWLGLSFGLKISVLPALAVFTVAALWRGRLAGIARAGAAFVLGWILAVPVLLAGPRGFKLWASWTIQNTGQGADDALVSWRSWLPWISGATAPSPWTLGLILALAAFLWLSWSSSREHSLESRGSSGFWAGLAGLAWALLVIVAVKRVWGFYLWIPLLLLQASALGAAAWGWRQGGLRRWAALALAGLLAVNAVATELPRLIRGLERQAQREQDPEHQLALQDREALRQYLAALPPHAGPWRMALDPFCYDPGMEALVTHTDIWGYFQAWGESPDLIVLGPRHEEKEGLPPSSVEYQGVQERRVLRAVHTADKDGHCGQAPCYRSEKLKRLVVLRKLEGAHGL
jgi:hypothetical protein